MLMVDGDYGDFQDEFNGYGALRDTYTLQEKELTESEIKFIQAGIKTWFDIRKMPLPSRYSVDGLIGGRTRSAITTIQKRLNRKETGQITEQFFSDLISAVRWWGSPMVKPISEKLGKAVAGIIPAKPVYKEEIPTPTMPPVAITEEPGVKPMPDLLAPAWKYLFHEERPGTVLPGPLPQLPVPKVEVKPVTPGIPVEEAERLEAEYAKKKAAAEAKLKAMEAKIFGVFPKILKEESDAINMAIYGIGAFTVLGTLYMLTKPKRPMYLPERF